MRNVEGRESEKTFCQCWRKANASRDIQIQKREFSLSDIVGFPGIAIQSISINDSHFLFQFCKSDCNLIYNWVNRVIYYNQ